MQDNFNIHEWRLNKAINELNENQLCKECGEGYMEEGQCMECGYMEEGAISNIQTPFYFKSKMGIEGMDKDATFQIQDIPNYGNIKVYYYDGILPRFFWMYKDELEKRTNKGDFIEVDKSQFQPNMEEGVTFTDKHDDNPKLKGGQKDLPDELQAGIIKKEGIEDWQRFYEEGYRAGYEHAKAGVKPMYEGMEGSLQHITRIEEIINYLASNISKNPDMKKENKISLLQSLKELKGHLDDLGSTIEQGDEYVADYSRRGDMNLKEDHEVAMAQASLKSIISSASQLMGKIGDEEIDLPGWIQDHITNAENFIDQANQGYHEL